jgi:hypothetical protein
MAGTGTPNLQSLQDQMDTLRGQLVEDRVDRATRNMESMRNWMMVYTPLVSLALLIFAVLGIRGLSDIQANREKFETIAGQAGTLLTNTNNRFEAMNKDFNNKFNAMNKEQEAFEKQVKENQQIVGQNKRVLGGFQSSLDELEKRHVELRATETKMEGDLSNLSREVKTTSSSLSSSIALTSDIGALVSGSLNVPLITSVYTAISMNQKIISGFGFGSSGRIFIKGWIGGVSLQDTLDLTNQPNPAEVPLGAISTWSDKAIICSESEIEKLTGGKAAPILVQVVTSTGTKSNVFSGVSAPSAPTGLKVTVSPQ